MTQVHFHYSKQGVFVDPSEAVFVMLGEQKDLEPHDDLRREILRRSLEADFKGFEAFIIANADTVMSRDNASLLAEVFPDVPHKGTISANGTLLSIDKAKRMLDYWPQYSWRNEIKG